jgi:membrane-bound ClpP family serine protease
MSAFLAAFLASLVCIVAGASEPGDFMVGALGVAAAVLGVVLVSNVNGSAVVMARFSAAARSGPLKFSGSRWTARQYRLLGAVYVVMGCAFAAIGLSGGIKWRR